MPCKIEVLKNTLGKKVMSAQATNYMGRKEAKGEI